MATKIKKSLCEGNSANAYLTENVHTIFWSNIVYGKQKILSRLYFAHIEVFMDVEYGCGHTGREFEELVLLENSWLIDNLVLRT